jgi:hypothetical protein
VAFCCYSTNKHPCPVAGESAFDAVDGSSTGT